MKLIKILMAMGLFFSAAIATAASPLKIGVVDLPQILQNSPQVAAINQKLQTQFGPQQQKVIAMQNQLRDDAKKLASGDATVKLTDQERKQIQDKVGADQKQLQQMVEQLQANVNAAQTKAMQDFMTQISNVSKNIAKQQNLDMVLLKPAVIFADNIVDITKPVLDQLPK